ncbi:sensor histidine kinase [Haloarcula marismortui]|uniref:histidine kinase n=1 Tax=Haloarcula marismortui ATCC 33800 TaxID=662476 RepID=M0K4U7_9EURY|nr:PAS domain-containing sensor histidine kinase [Haloarcula sinaiiensis]EMA15164.1 adaptive-response sensory-kinase [Haloarcula sinaiiensis ATCC 33800]QUJ71978.1 PAS domain S-box protein [Haloarcula sinaiiensis ATCC 33800]
MEDQCRVLAAAVETLDDVFYVYDADGKLAYWNARLNELFGLTDGELSGMDPTEFFVADDRAAVEAAIEDVFESGQTSVEARAETTEGVVTFELSGRLLTGDDGTVQGFSGVGRDITDRREREWHLERQNERLTEFADLLAHDLRTPLAVTSGHLELAAEELSPERIDAARDGLQRLESIIEDMRTATREGTLATDEQAVDIADVATTAWVHVETSNAVLEPPPPILVEADPERLLRLFENLFINAVTHGPGRDERTSDEDSGVDTTEITIRVVPTPDGFAIEDNGRGIAPDERERVFEPGASRAADGTGFGLYIVRAIAEAHGWTVRATAGEHGGARFEFDIDADTAC